MAILLLFRATLAEKVNFPVLHQGEDSYSPHIFLAKVYRAGY